MIKLCIQFMFLLLILGWMSTVDAKTIWNDNITFGATPSLNNKSITFGASGTPNIGGIRLNYSATEMQVSNDNSSWSAIVSEDTEPTFTTSVSALGFIGDGSQLTNVSTGTPTGTPSQVAAYDDSGDLAANEKITFTTTAVTVTSTVVLPNVLDGTGDTLGINASNEIVKVTGGGGSALQFQSYDFQQLGTNTSNNVGEIEFNLSGTFTLTETGTPLITAIDNSAQTRTEYHAHEDIVAINFRCQLPCTQSYGVGIFIDGSIAAKNSEGWSTSVNRVSGTFIGSISSGSYFTFGCVTGESTLGNATSDVHVFGCSFNAWAE